MITVLVIFFPSQHPFSEENFAELLYAVRLLENSRDPEVFKTEYMFVVHSYFEQFTTKVSNENKTITPEVSQLYTCTCIICSFSSFFILSLTAVRDYTEHC